MPSTHPRVVYAAYSGALIFRQSPKSKIYSPNNLLTLFSTLSFSGSYGWSFDGISSREGKAAVYVSTRCRIFSAIYGWLDMSQSTSM